MLPNLPQLLCLDADCCPPVRYALPFSNNILQIFILAHSDTRDTTALMRFMQLLRTTQIKSLRQNAHKLHKLRPWAGPGGHSLTTPDHRIINPSS